MFIFGLTGLFNWAVPLAIYASKFGLFQKRPVGFIGCNFWGIVMDVILAGTANLIVWNYFVIEKITFSSDDLARALILGLLATFITHIYMATTHWKEWIMPQPWHWNLGGYWHMFSETVQMSYLFYFPVSIANKQSLLGHPTTWITIVSLVLIGGAFMWALSVKDEGINWGWIRIGGEPW